MSIQRNKLYKRVLDGRCPISDTPFNEKEETIIVKYNDAKLRVKKKYVKFSN